MYKRNLVYVYIYNAIQRLDKCQPSISPHGEFGLLQGLVRPGDEPYNVVAVSHNGPIPAAVAQELHVVSEERRVFHSAVEANNGASFDGETNEFSIHRFVRSVVIRDLDSVAFKCQSAN